MTDDTYLPPAYRKPIPGLQGDYSGTCIACFQPTDTGFLVEGEAEWHMAILSKLGIPDDQVQATVHLIAKQNYGCAPGKVPTSDMHDGYRVCQSCVEARQFRVSLAANGQKVFMYLQPDHLRYGVLDA